MLVRPACFPFHPSILQANKKSVTNGMIPGYLNNLSPMRTIFVAHRFTLPLMAVFLGTVFLGTIPLGTIGRVRAAEQAAAIANVPRGREADDLGRFLGGLAGKPGSPFADLESTEAWQEHSRLSDKAWSMFAHDRQPALAAFGRSDLGDLGKPQATVFYPFSGPDALTAT